MGEIIRLCGVGMLCTVAGIIIKQIKGEFSPLIRICGAVIIFGAVIFEMGGVLSDLLSITEGRGLDSYAIVLLKALGIALVTKICSDICKDCGEGTVAGGIELGGKLAILVICIPLIGELIGYASEILNLG